MKILAEFVRIATSQQVEATAAKSAMKAVESMIEVMRKVRSERD